MNDYEKEYLIHYGIKGMHWGERRYQNLDGSLTALGKQRYSDAIRKAILSFQSRDAQKKAYYNAKKKAKSVLSSESRAAIAKNAQRTASINRLKYNITNLPNTIKNKLDYNKDGSINLTDAKAAAKRAASSVKNVASSVKNKLDYNKDGSLNIQDAKDAITNTTAYKKASKLATRAYVNVKKTSYKVSKKLSSKYEEVSDAVSDAYAKAKATIVSKYNNTVTSLSSAKTIASSFLSELKGDINTLVGKIAGKYDEGKEYVSRIVDSAKEFYEDPIGNFAESIVEKREEEEKKKRGEQAAENLGNNWKAG